MPTLTIYEDPKTCDIASGFLAGTLRQVMSCVEARSGSLFIVDPETRELILRSSYSASCAAYVPKGLRRKLGEGISGKVALLGQPVLVEDIRRDARFRRNGFTHYRTDSFICVPLVVGGRLFGLINVSDKQLDEPFSPEDFAFVRQVCTYACVVIDNLLAAAQIRKEKEKLSKEKSLLEKYAAVGKMASGIVHEISNPLDGVIRFTNMLLSLLKSDSTAKEYLLQIRKGLSSIDAIANSLRSFGCQFSESRKPERSGLSLAQLVDESLAVFQNRIAKKYRIKRRYAPGLKVAAEDNLQQVFVNIIKNALDAMPDGGTLFIRTGREDGQLVVRFRDTGPGITAEVKDHIFEPFFTTKGADKGAGLGLSICKEIVASHQGSIAVESSPRRGTQFSVFFPYLKECGPHV